ncbi:MAG: glycosyltransferase family 39 protein, partial [Anaerolineales bacterium]|nr:glycosyltransferase family 39 protein [Anaerolineales bacterium]
AWTLADGLLFLLLLLATIRNLADLGNMPLSVNEATNALASWLQWQPAGATAPLLPLSPAYLTFTSPFTQLFGSSDAMMRLVPALFGAALVALPWLLRRQLGPVGMLVSSALFLTSPTITAMARTADGSSLALFAALLLAISCIRLYADGDRRWLFSAAAMLGLGLATAPLFYGLLLTGYLGWQLQSRYGLVAEWDRPELNRADWRQAGLTALVVWIAASSMVLWAPGALAAAVTLPGTWLSQFFTGSDIFNWISPILAMGRYEIALLLLGLSAIAWATWSGHPLGGFFTYWFSSALVLILLQGAIVENLLLLVLPGYLLAGMLAQALTELKLSVRLWPFIIAGNVLLFGSFINLSRHLRHILSYPEQTGYQFIALFCFFFFIVVGALLPLLDVELPAVGQYAFFAVLPLLLFYSWGTGWWLGHEAANNPLERWVDLGTDGDIQEIVPTLREIARQAHGDPANLDLFVAHDSPVLSWYLREFASMEQGQGVPNGGQFDVIIAPTELQTSLSAAYIGSDFVLYQQQATVAGEVAGAAWQDILRWWIFRQSRELPVQERLILWVRADLAQ